MRAELDGDLGESLYEHLMTSEVRKLRSRIDRLIRAGIYPGPADRLAGRPLAADLTK